jgi:hypothetical protein
MLLITGCGSVATPVASPSSGTPSSSTPSSGTLSAISTVAAAYSLAGFMTDAFHVSAPSNPLAQQGLANIRVLTLPCRYDIEADNQ